MNEERINKIIGSNIRHRRKVLGIPPKMLADYLNLSDKQLYKYEAGESTLSASYLHTLSEVLSVEMNYFFSQEENNSAKPQNNNLSNKSVHSGYSNPIEISALNAAFSTIKDRTLRQKVIAIIKRLK